MVVDAHQKILTANRLLATPLLHSGIADFSRQRPRVESAAEAFCKIITIFLTDKIFRW
jgi:hypothetical protein